MSLKVLADELAKHGRFGDTALLHVHKDELAGLASLAPNGKLTINPKTGLPEAFFFLPFLASLFGGAGAGAAAAAIPAAATAAAGGGALASGIGAGLTAAGAAIPAAVAPAATAAGLGAGLGGAASAGIDALTTGSIVAPAATAAPIISGGTTAAGAAAANATPLIVGNTAAAAPGISALTAPAATSAGVGSITPAAAVAPVSSVATPGAIAAKTGAAAMTAPAPAAATGIQSINAAPFAGSAASGNVGGGLGGALSGGIKGLANMNPLTMMMIGQGVSGLAGMMKKKDKGEKEADISGDDYYKQGGVDPVFPGAGYRGGKDNEWDYFPGMATGGLVKGYAQGGMVKGYAGGGIAALANPPPGAGMLNGMPQSTMPSMQQPGQAMQPGMEPNPDTIPSSPYPKSQVGAPTDGDKELIAQTVAAIKGRHPNPEGILMAFIKQFGEQALQDLAARVKGAGAQQAPAGDGLSDSIPATIGGQEPTALSEGEFVVPSDVVSHLGNGSTDAGAGHLQNMVARTRAARGAPQTPAQIDPSQMMPA